MGDLQLLQHAELIARCRQERAAAAPAAPAAVELFRRAFDADQQAWAAIQQLYTPLMCAWVGQQPLVDVEDVLQEALCCFARCAPHTPTLGTVESLGPILAYLRLCVKTALLRALREERMHGGHQPGVAPCPGELALEELPSPRDSYQASLLRLTLRERLEHLLTTREERLLWRLYFVHQLPPRQILREHGEAFPTLRKINTLIQRLLRRLRSDPELRGLAFGV